MSRFLGRSLLICGLLFILTACQTTAQQRGEPEVDTFAVAELVFAKHLADQQLELAGQQLKALRQSHANEPSINALQQRLANAWLAAGEQALKDADIETASAALIQAKRLLPQAPALTEGLSTAITDAKKPVIEPSVKPSISANAPAAGKKAIQKKPAVLVEPEPAVVVTQPAPAPETQPSVVKPSKVKSRLIDVNAPFTVVPMPMLNTRSEHQLVRLLDAVAADVVKFRATVAIEVADTRDFHWVAALLLARVKKLDANFQPRLQEVIQNDKPAKLIITRNPSL